MKNKSLTSRSFLICHKSWQIRTFLTLFLLSLNLWCFAQFTPAMLSAPTEEQITEKTPSDRDMFMMRTNVTCGNDEIGYAHLPKTSMVLPYLLMAFREVVLQISEVQASGLMHLLPLLYMGYGYMWRQRTVTLRLT